MRIDVQFVKYTWMSMWSSVDFFHLYNVTSGLLGNVADAVVERTGVSNNYRCGMYELRNRQNVIFYYYFYF